MDSTIQRPSSEGLDFQQICPLCSSPGRFFYKDSKSQHRYFCCDFCDLAWLGRDYYLSREAEREHYSQHQNDPNDMRYRAFLNKLWEPLKSKLQPGVSGLDYGSGPGPTLHRMAEENGFHCLHYDPCFHPDKFVFGQQYDFITCSETAEHFHDPKSEFQQLRALLKPNAWLGVMTSRRTFDTDFANWHYRRERTHVMFYGETSFKVLADQHQFRPPEFPSSNVCLLQAL